MKLAYSSVRIYTHAQVATLVARFSVVQTKHQTTSCTTTIDHPLTKFELHHAASIAWRQEGKKDIGGENTLCELYITANELGLPHVPQSGLSQSGGSQAKAAVKSTQTTRTRLPHK